MRPRRQHARTTIPTTTIPKATLDDRDPSGEAPGTQADPGALRDARALRLLPGCLAVFMSAFVAAVVTAINTGVDPIYPERWLHAWALACPAAIAAAYVFRPLAWRLARLLAR